MSTIYTVIRVANIIDEEVIGLRHSSQILPRQFLILIICLFGAKGVYFADGVPITGKPPSHSVKWSSTAVTPLVL